MKKRVLAIVMCICMILTILSLCAFTASSSNVENGAYQGNVWKATGTGSLSYCTVDGTKLCVSKTAVDKGNNTFDINLKVVAESSEKLIVPGAAATVLLIDTSESMNYCSVCGQQFCWDNAPSRLAVAKNAAVSFLDSYKGDVAGAGRFISLVQFSDKSSVALGWVDVSTKEGYNAAVKAIENMGTNYGTNLDAGLCNASFMFTAPELCIVAPANRYVVTLSDGAPNLSRSGGSGIYGSMQVNADTAAAAQALRCCASVYTIGFGTPCETTYAGGPSVNDFLRDSIANPAFGGFTYAYTADTASQLYSVFSMISKSIKTSIGSSGEGAVVVDPMGDFVSVVSCPDNFKAGMFGYEWKLGNVEPKVVSKGGCTSYIYTYKLTYTVKLDVDAEGFDENVFHPANKPTYLKWSCCECFAFPVPGLRGETSRYTVIFNQGANGDIAGQDKDGNVTHPDLKKWTRTPAAPAVTPDVGYHFTGWAPALADKVTCDVTYVAQYAPNCDTPYTIEYYLEQLDGSFALEKAVDKTGVTDTLVQITSGDVLNFPGFTFDKNVKGTVLSGTIAGDGSLTLKLFYVRNSYDYSIEYYYGGLLDESKTELGNAKYGTVIESYTDKPIPGYAFTKVENMPLTVGDGENVAKVFYDPRTDLTYTVNYLWNGTDTPVAPSLTVYNQVLGATAEESPLAIEGFTPVSNDAQSIVIAADGNVINFYYYKNVTLTANSAEFVYDGNEHSVSGFTGMPEEAAFEPIEVGASGIDAATYPAAFAEDVVGTVDSSAKYIIAEAVDGQLVITPIELVTVNVKGNEATVEYNGSVQSVEGYVITAISDPAYKEGYIAFSGEAVASGIYADTYPMELSATQFANTNANFKEVVFVVEDGKLTITPIAAPIVITANSAEKAYDGLVLSDSGYTYTENVLLPGDELVAVVEGSQLNAGTSANCVVSYAVMHGDADVTAQYTFAPCVDGTLTVTPIDVVITTGSAEKAYDGEALTCDTFSVEGLIGDDSMIVTVTGAQLDAGSSANTAEYSFGEGTCADNYNVTVNAGTLTVTPIDVVITSGSADKTYDGKALVCDEVTAVGFVEGEGASYTMTGSQTNVGSSKNSFEYALNENTNADNYNISVVEGTLTVTPADVTITSGSANKVYDGKALTCGDVTAVGFAEGEGASYKVTGSQTEVGSSKNTFEYTLNENTDAANYNITVVEGTLTVTPEAAPKTGDDTNSTLWACLMGLSAAGIAGIAVTRKKEEI